MEKVSLPTKPIYLSYIYILRHVPNDLKLPINALKYKIDIHGGLVTLNSLRFKFRQFYFKLNRFYLNQYLGSP